LKVRGTSLGTHREGAGRGKRGGEPKHPCGHLSPADLQLLDSVPVNVIQDTIVPKRMGERTKGSQRVFTCHQEDLVEGNSTESKGSK
jgi:hypothetical protein